MAGKVDSELEPFVRELYRQCNFGVRAFRELQAAYDARSEWDLDYLYPIQNLLVAAAIVSRILWPTKDKHAERGRTLRHCLEVADASPLKDRKIRDRLEHIDEKIEEWRRRDGKTHMDAIVGSRGFRAFLVKMSYSEVSLFRHYDPSTYQFSFWGDTHDLSKLAALMGDLIPYLTQQLLPRPSGQR